jgi:2-oxoacid:acceptor oxidoreductase gamma subunit (pyruvate/2-ketoisovalerate family)
MKEIRLHGRGGQGMITAAEIIAAAMVAEGKYAACFPMFGFERRGAPVTAFIRLDEQPIREKTQIYTPDCLVVADLSLGYAPMTYAGLKENAILVMNSARPSAGNIPEKLAILGVVDATRIALEEVGAAVVNTCLVGAFAGTTAWVKLESLLESLDDYFSGPLLEKNRRCIERGFAEVKVVQLKGEVSHAT